MSLVTNHVEGSAVLQEHSVDSQLRLIYAAQHYCADLKGPPLKHHHQVAESTKTHKLPPLCEALKAPPTPGQLVEFTTLDVDSEENGDQRCRNNQGDCSTTTWKIRQEDKDSGLG